LILMTMKLRNLKMGNEFIKSHGIDRLALLGMSLRKMIKIIDNLREEAENE